MTAMDDISVNMLLPKIIIPRDHGLRKAALGKLQDLLT